ncbi:TPA: hypothetical protein H1005_03640 [archaeon]|nr:hypothetical protein [Candidatus Naiadarchaeales archaeon SRR2090153.bin1042]
MKMQLAERVKEYAKVYRNLVGYFPLNALIIPTSERMIWEQAGSRSNSYNLTQTLSLIGSVVLALSPLFVSSYINHETYFEKFAPALLGFNLVSYGYERMRARARNGIENISDWS